MALLLSANNSNVSITVEGQDPHTIEGLQSITYKSFQEKQDVSAIGTDERIDIVQGLRVVRGMMTIKSTNNKLNDILANGTSFQLVANLKSRKGEIQNVTFDLCYLEHKEFELGVSGVSSTTYFFNSTNVREEVQ